MNGIDESVSVAEFIKEVAVGQLFMVYLRHQDTYWPAKVIDIPNTTSQHPSHLIVTLYRLNSSKSHNMYINLKNTPMKQFIPFESVYQQYLKSGKSIKNIQNFTSSSSFQKAMKMAAKDYEARLKTPKMYKELKKQSQKITQKITINLNSSSNAISSNQAKTITVKKESLKVENKVSNKASKRLENKQVQIHYNNSSIKFSQQLKNKTEAIQNPPKSRSKNKKLQNNEPILLQQNSQENLQTSKTKSEINNDSSVSSKMLNKSQKKQNKCSKKDPIIKRDYNRMKGIDSSKIEIEQSLILQHPIKKRKSSKASMSVIYLQPKEEIPKKPLNYCESEKISNRSKTSESVRMSNQNNKAQKKNTMVLKELGKNEHYSSSSKSIISYSSKENKISQKLQQSLVKAGSKEVEKKVKTKNTKNLQQKETLLTSSSVSSKTRSQSQKNSMKKSNQDQLSKRKALKKQPKQITPKIKLESTEKIKKESAKQKKQIVKKQSSKAKNNKPQKVNIKKIQEKSEQGIQPQKCLKGSKHQLLLSRLLFDHSKNKFPILSKKSSSNVLYVRKTKQHFSCQCNVEIKSFNELVNFVKRLQEQQMLNKSLEIKFILYEELSNNERDPYVLTYSQLSQINSIQKIVLQDEQSKFTPTKHLLANNLKSQQQWSIQTFLLQSICSLISSWNITSLQSKNLLLSINDHFVLDKSGIQRVQKSSVSKRGKGKSGKKSNSLLMQCLKCHQYCYSIGLQERAIAANLMELIKMYFTYQSTTCQNFTSQQQNLQQNVDKYNQIEQQSLLQRMKKRHRHLLTYHNVIKKEVEQTLKIISNQPQKILKKEQKVQQCSLSIQEQTVTPQVHHIFSFINNSKSGVKKKTNHQKDVICWINSLQKQLSELLNLMNRTQSNLVTEISRLQKQEYKAVIYFGNILANHSTTLINNTGKPISLKSGQQKIAWKIPNNNFAESLQLPKQTCFDLCPLQNEVDLKEKEFQEFLKRVLNVESLEGVYTNNFYKGVTFLNPSPQSYQNMIPSNQSLMRSEVSFSEMETLKSDILNAFDELQNELLHKQKDEISY